MSAYEASVDDINSRIVYSPGWETISGSPSTNEAGTEHYTSVLGSTATFQFDGSAVYVRFAIPLISGKATFQIDNGPISMAYYSNPTSYAVEDEFSTWKSEPLTPGRHTLLITNIGADASLTIDSIDYKPYMTVVTITPGMEQVPTTSSTTLLPTATSSFLPSSDTSFPDGTGTGISRREIIGLSIAGAIFFLMFTLWVFSRIRKQLRIKDLEKASFPDYMYSAKEHERSDLSLSKVVQAHNFTDFTKPFRDASYHVSLTPPQVLPVAYSRPRSGPMDNIIAAHINTTSIPVTFTHARLSNETPTRSFTRSPLPTL